ncbi:MAG: hypothetical protein C4297_07585 [Gemmataceae bacterium]
MIRCPSCQFENEDGALFCEYCKSDLPVPAAVTEPAGTKAEVVGATVPVVELVGEPAGTPVAAECASSEVALAPEPLAQQATPQRPGLMARVEVVSEVPPPAQTAAATPAPPATRPRLVVIRGLKIGVEYPLYEGENYVGRTDEKPVDIDLEDQESPDRIWSSRQHAVIRWQEGQLTIEDLGSTNGTFVNRVRVPPGERRPLNAGDVIQIGTVHLRVHM